MTKPRKMALIRARVMQYTAANAKSARRGRVEARARRRLGIREAISFDASELERVEALAGQERWASVLLERLPAGQREAIRAHILEGRPYSELAAHDAPYRLFDSTPTGGWSACCLPARPATLARRRFE